MRSNVWLLTEERPKRNVIEKILIRFCLEKSLSYSSKNIRILPVMSQNQKFTFQYCVIGFKSKGINKIFIIPVSGYSSFVDYMLFYQERFPSDKEKPLFLIEETKTDDSESRNTGVYQRSSKFVFTEFFYPNVKKIMLYSLQVKQKITPTRTYIFGTKMLLTLGVEIIGKTLDSKIFTPFKNIDELIKSKNSMPGTHNGVSIKMKKDSKAIYISARLEKSGRLASDPSIGTIAIMAACLRKLGWTKKIIITQHGVPNQRAVGNNTKFNFIAHQHNIELENLFMPKVELPKRYWKRETVREKTGTIFLHVICENLVDGVSIYENHGGCERGYFLDLSSNTVAPVVIPKYTDREKYKKGNKEFIVYIPDLVIMDEHRKEIINLEGKTFANKKEGIVELRNFDYFEKKFIKKYYSRYKLKRGLVLAGEGDIIDAKKIKELVIYLDSEGTITVGQRASQLVIDAVKKLSSI